MIKKIICPFDFSPSAFNGAEYAARLANALGTEILFMNMHRIIPVAAAVSLGEGIGYEAVTSGRQSTTTLEALCGSIKKTFQVPADYEVIVSTSSFISTLLAADLTDAMIVMGTNGADTFYQALFGSHSYNTLKRSKCPVLVIPANAEFGNIARVVVGWDRIASDFSGVISLLERFKPHYTFAHLEEKNEDYAFEQIEHILETTREAVGDEQRVGSELLPGGKNFAAAVNNYADRVHADLLVLFCDTSRILSRLLAHHHNRTLAEKSRYPLLVIPVSSR